MKKIINASMLALVALLLTFNAQAQTATTSPAPTPERIDLSKEGDLKAIQFTLKLYETKKFVFQLPKDKYLWVYFLDPSMENATNPLVQVDSAQSSYAGASGTTDYNGTLPTKITWELMDNADKKIFAGSDVKIDSPQISADGEYFLTIKCMTGECKNWLRVKVDKTAAVQTATVDFP